MTAHLTYHGGGLLIPARTPYERQVLREHVLACARHQAHLRVKVGRQLWTIERPTAERPHICVDCDRQLTVAALFRATDPRAHCVRCALR